MGTRTVRAADTLGSFHEGSTSNAPSQGFLYACLSVVPLFSWEGNACLARVSFAQGPQRSQCQLPPAEVGSDPLHGLAHLTLVEL